MKEGDYIRENISLRDNAFKLIIKDTGSIELLVNGTNRKPLFSSIGKLDAESLDHLFHEIYFRILHWKQTGHFNAKTSGV
jgi:hypothetical protein